jgi:hypothetical protein
MGIVDMQRGYQVHQRLQKRGCEMSKAHLLSLGIALTMLVLMANVWADEKEMKGKGDGSVAKVEAKKELTKEEKVAAEVKQQIDLPCLEVHYKTYEHYLTHKPHNKLSTQIIYAQRLAGTEKLFRDQVNDIINRDPDSKYAEEARKWLKRFEKLKKYGPTM